MTAKCSIWRCLQFGAKPPNDYDRGQPQTILGKGNSAASFPGGEPQQTVRFRASRDRTQPPLFAELRNEAGAIAAGALRPGSFHPAQLDGQPVARDAEHARGLAAMPAAVLERGADQSLLE